MDEGKPKVVLNSCLSFEKTQLERYPVKGKNKQKDDYIGEAPSLFYMGCMNKALKKGRV